MFRSARYAKCLNRGRAQILPKYWTRWGNGEGILRFSTLKSKSCLQLFALLGYILTFCNLIRITFEIPMVTFFEQYMHFFKKYDFLDDMRSNFAPKMLVA